MINNAYISIMIATVFGGWMVTPSVEAQHWQIDSQSSRFEISGTSNVNSFKCDASLVIGSGDIYPEGIKHAAARWHIDTNGFVQLPVSGIECGMLKMTLDLHHALRADRFPVITFSITEATIEAAGDSFLAKINGQLVLAGVSKTVHFNGISAVESFNQYRVRGTSLLKMSDFGIAPPSAFLGVVRADDNIQVNFDLRVLADSSSTISKQATEKEEKWPDDNSDN